MAKLLWLSLATLTFLVSFLLYDPANQLSVRAGLGTHSILNAGSELRWQTYRCGVAVRFCLARWPITLSYSANTVFSIVLCISLLAG